MGSIDDAAQALRDALSDPELAEDVRHFPDVGPAVTPPATVMGPPAFTWETPCDAPTSARWLVYVIVSADDRAMQRLFDLLPKVAAALDAVTDATVVRADPGTYPTSNGDLPAYEIQVDYSL